MAVPAPRDTEDTRGRRLLHIPTYTVPPPAAPPPLPAAPRAGKTRPPCRRPEAAGRARKAVAAERRCWGCHVGAVWGRVSAGDAEVRAGTAKASGLQLFSSDSCRKRGEGGGPAGLAGCTRGGGSLRGLKWDPEISAEDVRRKGLGRVFPGLGLFRGLRQKSCCRVLDALVL